MDGSHEPVQRWLRPRRYFGAGISSECPSGVPKHEGAAAPLFSSAAIVRQSNSSALSCKGKRRGAVSDGRATGGRCHQGAGSLGDERGDPLATLAGQTPARAEPATADAWLGALGKELVGLQPGCDGGRGEGVATGLGTCGCSRVPSGLRERPAPKARVMPRMLVGCRGVTPGVWGPDLPPPAPTLLAAAGAPG